MNEMRPYAGSPSFGSLGTFSVSLCNRTFSSALPALGGSGAAPPLKASAFLFFLHFHLPLTSILSYIAGFIAFCCRQILLHTFFFFFFFELLQKWSYFQFPIGRPLDCMFSYLLICRFYIVHMGHFSVLLDWWRMFTLVCCVRILPLEQQLGLHCFWMSELLFSSPCPG